MSYNKVFHGEPPATLLERNQANGENFSRHRHCASKCLKNVYEGHWRGGRMNYRLTWDTATLITATAFTRYIFRSHYLYDVDSVNFALAMERFDPSVHQPHPPGYFLYVYLGRLVNLLFHDANAALVAMSIVFGCGAVAMIYALADSWFGRNAALFAGLIFVFSPLAWFHGIVALTYIIETFFSALTGYLCWRICRGSRQLVLPCAVVVGVAAGFRPSSLLLLGPLLLFSFHKVSLKQAGAGIAALAATLSAWFMPMIRISGGQAYFSSLLSLWLTVPARGMVFNSSVLNSFARAGVIVAAYCLFFGCAAILPFQMSRNTSIDRPRTIFICIWIVPGLLFFALIYLKLVNSGYLLALSPPLCVWMGVRAAAWYADLRLSKVFRILTVAGCAAANTMIFVFAPVYCSYGSVRRFERELETVIRVLSQIASPRDTLIVGFDSHFLGYRHAGYYLPEYVTVQFPKVQLASGKCIFSMENRNTSIENRVDTTDVQRFILFPLPLGDTEYSDYTASIRKRFPTGELDTVVKGDHEFAFGPVADLGVLFPDSTSPATKCVDWR